MGAAIVAGMMPGTCALCRKTGVELLDSHLLPKWAYKRPRGGPASGNPNPNPVLVSDGCAVQTSRQITQYLLCDPCEQRFGKHENRVSQLCWQTDGTFPLREASPWTRQDDDGFALAEIDEATSESLGYFGLSVVWRADVMNQDVSLGEKYREVLRGYLNGETVLPANVQVSVVVFRPGTEVTSMDRVMGFPTSARGERFHRHAFIVSGLEFAVLAGSKLPEDSDEVCLIRGATKRIVMLRPEASALVDGVIKMGGSARPSRALDAWRKRRNSREEI